MPKIITLTTDQSKKLAKYQNEWLKIGLSIEPCCRESVKLAINNVYSCAGLLPPNIFVWLKSPLEGVIAAIVFSQVGDQVGDQVGAQVGAKVRAQVGDQVGAQVGAKVRAQVGDQVGAQVGAQVWDQVGAKVWDQVGDQVGDQVWDQVDAQVWDQVGAKVWDQVGDQVWDQVWDQALYGVHDASWLAFYAYFNDVCKLNLSKLSGLWNLARTSGWVWCFKNCVVLTERPTVLKHDEMRQLHCEIGPAIQYSDGWGVWAYHGQRISREIVEMPEIISFDRIANETNQKIKEFMFKQYCFRGKLAISKELEGAIRLIFDDLLVLLRKPNLDHLRVALVQLQIAVLGSDSVINL